jgi:hypothetical protein
MWRRANLIAPSGYGKSALSLEVAGVLKRKGISIEYINEFAKAYLYEDRPRPDSLDQIYIGANQMYMEKRALQHNDYIISDSPLILAAVYAQFYSGDIKASSLLRNMATRFEETYPSINIYWDKPNFAYEQKGRWQNEAEASEVQNLILKYTLDHFEVRHARTPEEAKELIYGYFN